MNTAHTRVCRSCGKPLPNSISFERKCSICQEEENLIYMNNPNPATWVRELLSEIPSIPEDCIPNLIEHNKNRYMDKKIQELKGVDMRIPEFPGQNLGASATTGTHGLSAEGAVLQAKIEAKEAELEKLKAQQQLNCYRIDLQIAKEKYSSLLKLWEPVDAIMRDQEFIKVGESVSAKALECLKEYFKSGMEYKPETIRVVEGDKSQKLTNADLIQKCNEWVSELCKTGGKGWTLRIPPDTENDPDILFTELANRYKSLLKEFQALKVKHEF